ncbi:MULTISPECIES: hydroxyacid dehydrogenase [Agrobacterium]|uniref:hydroxyacid dehydrogenase n=1 Tax=Agrobacterium TaxID=357 RepID=UPI0022CB3D32|nr:MULTISPECIES: hydroxyacid dehydrogenase [Agrobacterium]MCZ7866180.1 hydroxyacid dehydrogenase [Agrobacterium salinitolerans]MDA5639308.1 hydroxyacid dehydrogenase [Agrobacterium sp. ST15.13.013]MDA6999217.1 hydroxyacid dehydrogenase [Agrobacterium salinitolerans]
MRQSQDKPRLLIAMRNELPEGFFGSREWARLNAIADIIPGFPYTDFDTAAGAEALVDADILLSAWGTPSLTRERLARAPKLRMVAYAASSVRTVAPAEFWETSDILLTTAASAMAVPVAEFTYAAIIMSGKDVFRLRDEHRAERGTGGFGSRRGMSLPYLGNYSRKVGIVGASRIGRLVMELLARGKFQIAVYDPFISAEDAAAFAATKMELDELLVWSDVVSLHAPILPETRHMIGARELALMADHAIFINTARGWLVDHDALLTEAVSGRLRILIDTPEPEPLPPDSPFYDLPNVVLTPHIAGALGNELRALSDLAITEIERFVAGLEPLHPVHKRDMERMA